MGDLSWPDLIMSLVSGEHLPPPAISWAMTEIMAGNAAPEHAAAFLVGLRAKGEHTSEVAEIAKVMLANAIRVHVAQRAVDVVGTGGDRARTVNISTMSAIVVAGAGIPVLKHGGRAASSASGTADVLSELGIRLDLTPEAVAQCFSEVGIAFCFAPTFHPGLRYVAPVRRALGIPTVFNFVAPLLNPAQPTSYLIGCADPRMAGVIADVLAMRGASAIVAHGEDGLDEITTAASTRIWVVNDGAVREDTLDSRSFGLRRSEPGALVGGDPAYNAAVVRRVVDGEAGPIRDAVLLNAGAAIAAYTGLGGGDLHAAISAGVERATAAIDTGEAAKKLDRWIRFVAGLSTGN